MKRYVFNIRFVFALIIIIHINWLHFILSQPVAKPIKSFCIGSNNYVCAVFNSGQMKCWGHGINWGLPSTDKFGDDTSRIGDNIPFINVGTSVTVDTVSCGDFYVCVKLSTGVLKCLGYNNVGQTGNGFTSTYVGQVSGHVGDGLPAVNLGTGLQALDITLAYAHTCVRVTGNKVKCFGWNNQGQLGYGDQVDRGASTSQMGDNLAFVDLGTNVEVASVHAGPVCSHTCAILSAPIASAQRIKCWGLNAVRQLGYSDGNNRGIAAGQMGDNLPLVDLGTESRVKIIAIGRIHTCVLLFSNIMKCFGYGALGQLGSGSTNDITSTGNSMPSVIIDSGRTVKLITAGEYHTCIVYDDQLTMKCIGDNARGQLGQGDTSNRGGSPGTTIPSFSTIDLGTAALKISSIYGAMGNSCVIFEDYRIKCFGKNDSGQMAIGSTVTVGDNPGEMGVNLQYSNLFSPTKTPTKSPTLSPTRNPTKPTQSPTTPTQSPTTKPTRSPIKRPTRAPTLRSPTENPTSKPTLLPSNVPTTQAPTSKCTAIDKFNWESNDGQSNVLIDLDTCSKTATCGNVLLQVGKEQEARDCVEKCLKTNNNVKSKSYTDLCLSCIVDFAACQYSQCDVCKSGRNKNICIECTNISKCKNEFKSCTGTIEMMLNLTNETANANINDSIGAIVGSVLGAAGIIALSGIFIYYKRVKRQEQIDPPQKYLSTFTRMESIRNWQNKLLMPFWSKSSRSNLLINNNSNNYQMSVLSMNQAQQNAYDQWENKGGLQLIGLFDFVGENATELTIKKGQLLEAMATNGTWYLVKDPETNQTGIVPCNYLQQI